MSLWEQATRDLVVVVDNGVAAINDGDSRWLMDADGWKTLRADFQDRPALSVDDYDGPREVRAYNRLCGDANEIGSVVIWEDGAIGSPWALADLTRRALAACLVDPGSCLARFGAWPREGYERSIMGDSTGRQVVEENNLENASEKELVAWVDVAAREAARNGSQEDAAGILAAHARYSRDLVNHLMSAQGE